MATKERTSGGLGGLGGALAVFAILCGVLLLLIGGGDDGAADSVDEQSIERQAWSAKESTEKAQRALTNADYGEARQHVRDAKRQLDDMVKAYAGQGD